MVLHWPIVGTRKTKLGRPIMPLFSSDSIQSLALRTDLLFHRLGGLIEAREGYLVVRTPSNPGFFYGNMLVYPRPPLPGEARGWARSFAEEFRTTPAVRHACITWDGTDGEVG